MSRPKTARLFLEHLEDRALLSSYTAGSVSDLAGPWRSACAPGNPAAIREP
ncbi:MAG: hypothetical protein ACHRXM_37905 [Isosphaerales bacterium]